MPVGGACALMGQLGRSDETEVAVDPELEEFRKQEKYIQKNLKCAIDFSQSLIPPEKGKITGMMVLEARKDIEHSGIFVLIKGQPLTEKKRKGKRPLTRVKFVMTESKGGAGGERVKNTMMIDAGSKETYPVELDIPEELPLPVVNSRGCLMYRVHACMYPTTKKRHVVVAESYLRWQGFKRLELEEVKNERRIEQLLQSKRGMMGLGRRKNATMEWKVAKGGYLPGEKVHVELWGECKDKDGLGIECKVELLQKVLYQVPSGVRSVKLWTQMNVNVLATGGTEEDEPIEVMDAEDKRDDESKKMLLWRGKLKVPRGITPTMRFDFMNSVSYTVKASAGIAGESKETWVTGEVPLLIGTSKVIDDDDSEKKSGDEEEEDDAEGDYDPGCPPRSPIISPCNTGMGMHHPRSGSRGAHIGACRSLSLGFIPNAARPMTGSVSSMESLASSTLSIFKLPVAHSQLSRRQTLESLPLPHSELDLPAQAAPIIVVHQQGKVDTTVPADMSNLGSGRLGRRQRSEEDAKTKDAKANN